MTMTQHHAHAQAKTHQPATSPPEQSCPVASFVSPTTSSRKSFYEMLPRLDDLPHSRSFRPRLKPLVRIVDGSALSESLTRPIRTWLTILYFPSHPTPPKLTLKAAMPGPTTLTPSKCPWPRPASPTLVAAWPRWFAPCRWRASTVTRH